MLAIYMAIIKNELGQYRVEEVLKASLRIPPYQRPYSWRPETAQRLLYDLFEALENAPNRYLLGTLVLHKNEEDEQTFYDIVDGQHRLLTLKVILNLLDGNNEEPSSKETPLAQVHRTLAALLQRKSKNDREKFEKLKNFIYKNCELFQVVTDDLDEAFRIFDTQNTRGKPLEPHELLKAYHLRAIKNPWAPDVIGLIQRWDALNGQDNTKQALKTLFASYLYPIARWLRNESAKDPFSHRHLALFKGFSDLKLPAARYHQQATQCDESTHARFQLDAPMQDGVYFFKFILFMYDELNKLAREGFDGDLFEFSYYGEPPKVLDNEGADPSLKRRNKSSYRYVTELYLAALLYFVNRFGYNHFDEACDSLMKWAYSVRISNTRLSYASVDNYARGEGKKDKHIHQYPLFHQLRHATDPIQALLTIPAARPSLEEGDLQEEREKILQKVFAHEH
jgi:hypothetical protein